MQIRVEETDEIVESVEIAEKSIMVSTDQSLGSESYSQCKQGINFELKEQSGSQRVPDVAKSRTGRERSKLASAHASESRS
jgi:hypothetical protein